MESGADENELLLYEEKDICGGMGKCKFSLIERIITDKYINFSAFETALKNIWCNPKGLCIEELEGKFYHIYFDREYDLNRILENGPWLFRNSWIIMKK